MTTQQLSDIELPWEEQSSAAQPVVNSASAALPAAPDGPSFDPLYLQTAELSNLRSTLHLPLCLLHQTDHPSTRSTCRPPNFPTCGPPGSGSAAKGRGAASMAKPSTALNSMPSKNWPRFGKSCLAAALCLSPTSRSTSPKKTATSAPWG